MELSRLRGGYSSSPPYEPISNKYLAGLGRGESLNKNMGLWESDVTFLRQFSHLKVGRYIYIFLDPWSVVQIIIDAVCKSLGAVPVLM